MDTGTHSRRPSQRWYARVLISTSMTMDQVTQLLTQQGYTGITGLHESGRDWVGEAEMNQT